MTEDQKNVIESIFGPYADLWEYEAKDRQHIRIKVQDENFTLTMEALDNLATAFRTKNINIIYTEETPDLSEVTAGDPSEFIIDITL